MKATKWRDLSEDELNAEGRELAEELFNLRFQLSMGVAKNPVPRLARPGAISRGSRRPPARAAQPAKA